MINDSLYFLRFYQRSLKVDEATEISFKGYPYFFYVTIIALPFLKKIFNPDYRNRK